MISTVQPVDDDFGSAMPNAAYVNIVKALLRAFLQVAAGLGFGWGATISGDQQAQIMIASAIVMISTIIWSSWQKIQAERHKHQAVMATAMASADASARTGVATAVPIMHPADVAHTDTP